MGISERTKKRIWAKSGGKCAFPGCGEDLIGEKGTILGEVCHIVARKEDGPRGRKSVPVIVISLIIEGEGHHNGHRYIKNGVYKKRVYVSEYPVPFVFFRS